MSHETDLADFYAVKTLLHLAADERASLCIGHIAAVPRIQELNTIIAALRGDAQVKRLIAQASMPLPP